MHVLCMCVYHGTCVVVRVVVRLLWCMCDRRSEGDKDTRKIQDTARHKGYISDYHTSYSPLFDNASCHLGEQNVLYVGISIVPFMSRP